MRAKTEQNSDGKTFNATTAVFYANELEPVKEHDHDFIWSLKEEPHFSRRKAILKKYPEVSKNDLNC
jgi:hypothetical protein